LSGGTAQSGRSHCSIQAESLLNFAGRADFAERCTHLAVLTSFSAQFSNRRGCISDSFVTYVLKITLSFLRTDIFLSLALTQVQ
ncbi:MAG: hypothetical protein Q4E87_06585, partial [bacterium]|nr:hypothetical protein [bacterium]